jgi:hypothetical protein
MNIGDDSGQRGVRSGGAPGGVFREVDGHPVAAGESPEDGGQVIPGAGPRFDHKPPFGRLPRRHLGQGGGEGEEMSGRQKLAAGRHHRTAVTASGSAPGHQIHVAFARQIEGMASGTDQRPWRIQEGLPTNRTAQLLQDLGMHAAARRSAHSARKTFAPAPRDVKIGPGRPPATVGLKGGRASTDSRVHDAQSKS